MLANRWPIRCFRLGNTHWTSKNPIMDSYFLILNDQNISQMLRVQNIYLRELLNLMVNVDKYSSPTEHLGIMTISQGAIYYPHGDTDIQMPLRCLKPNSHFRRATLMTILPKVHWTIPPTMEKGVAISSHRTGFNMPMRISKFSQENCNLKWSNGQLLPSDLLLP